MQGNAEQILTDVSIYGPKMYLDGFAISKSHLNAASLDGRYS